MKDGRVLAGKILQEKSGRIRFLVLSGTAKAEIDVVASDVQEIIRAEH